MRWIITMSVGAISGWLIASVTDEIAIAAASGAAIGILTAIALFGTSPVRSVFKTASAMAVGSLAGWVVASFTDHLHIAMAVGSAVGALATIAVISERPIASLLKLVAAMAFGFLVGWGIGSIIGDHRIGFALSIPLALPLLLLMADTTPKPRHRPF